MLWTGWSMEKHMSFDLVLTSLRRLHNIALSNRGRLQLRKVMPCNNKFSSFSPRRP